MKRGFLLAILSLFTVITFGGFGTPEKAHVAAPYSSTTTQNLYLKGVDIFDHELTVLQNNPSTTTPKINPVLIKLVKYGKSVFIGVYDLNIQSSYEPQKAYESAADVSASVIRDLSSNSNGDQSFELSSNEKAIVSDGNGDGSGKTIRQEFASTIIFSEHSGMSTGSTYAAQASAVISEMPNASQEEKRAATVQFDNKASGCETIMTASITDCVVAGFDWFVRNTVLKVGSWALRLGAYFIDRSIDYSITHFSERVPPGINSLWKLVRDVLYLCIVFVGFYLAFMYIIGRDEKFKKFIPWLIMFALFVNFSLPITKAMIDMSNIVALNIYSSAIGTGTSGSGAIMERLGFNTLLSENATQGADISATLLACVFVFFGAWVFFQIAILMMVRTVVLTLCIIGSPFLLIDAMVTVPFFGDRVKQVRSAFFNQLFIADVFMIMFFITLQVMGTLKQIAMSSLNMPATGIIDGSLVFGIFIMLMLLHFMMKITKSMSGEVGSIATGFVNNGVGLLAGGTVGLGAMVGRRAIGGAAARILEKDTGLGGWMNRKEGMGGRMAHSLTNSLANSTFDARNSGIAQKFSTATKINLGAGGKTGYQQNLEAKIKEKNQEMNSIRTTYTRDVLDNDGNILHRKGERNDEGVKAREKFQERAGGAFTDKAKIREALEKNNDTEEEIREADREKALAKYKRLEGDEKQAHFDKQDAETKKKIETYNEKIAEEKKEKNEQKELNKRSVAANEDMGKNLQSFVEALKQNQAPQSSGNSNSSAEDFKNNMNQNPPPNISRGGRTDETTTASGIILPKSA